MRYNSHTENERIVEKIERNTAMIDHAERNNDMLIMPTWRRDTKEKWLTKVSVLYWLSPNISLERHEDGQ